MKTSVRTNEYGMGAVLVIVALVVLAGVGAAGWLVLKNKDKSTTSTSTNSAASKVVSDECNKVYKDKDLCKFAGNFSLAGVSYKAVFTSSKGTAGSSDSTTISTDAKGNTSMSNVSASGKTEFITLDGVSYMKDEASGTWWKFGSSTPATDKPTNPTSDIKFDTKAPADNTGTQALPYKKLGSEKCGNLTCLKYEVIDTAQSGKSFFWFDTKDYRLQRWSTTDANGATNDAVFTYQPVTITAPTPVKDFSADAAAAQAAAQAAVDAANQQ